MCNDLKCEDSIGFYIGQFIKCMCIIVCVGLLLSVCARLSGAEVFKVDLPSGTASCNGDWIIKGGQVKEIYTQDGNKLVEAHMGKFIVYDVSSDLVFGRVYFDCDVTSKSFELDINVTCASSDALPIMSNGLYVKRWAYKGINKEQIER